MRTTASRFNIVFNRKPAAPVYVILHASQCGHEGEAPAMLITHANS
jgi:hypothetical protein